jgi:hypothetical protein
MVKPIEIQSYVRWPVKGGVAMGKVLSFKDDKVACVETPTGTVSDISIAELIPSSEEEYNSSLEELVSNLSKKNTRKNKKEEFLMKKDTQACDNIVPMDEVVKAAVAKEVEAIKQEYDAKVKSYEDAVNAAKEETVNVVKQLESMKKELDETKAALEAAQAVANAAQAEMDKMKKESLAKMRFDELKTLDAEKSIASDEKEILSTLAEMDDKTYNAILKVAKSSYEKIAKANQTNLQKVTDQAQTSLPKTTEQTQTNQPKLTEAEDASGTALDNATKDAEPNLATAGVSHVKNRILTDWAKSVLEKKSVKKSDKK